MTARVVTASISRVAKEIVTERRAIAPERALIVGISGIDGSGKGYVATRLAQLLRKQSLGVVVIGADGWLNLPSERFNDADPGRHFYKNAIRLEEMFTQVVSPLRNSRALACEVDHLEETANSFRRQRYQFESVDVALIEGIFLFKPGYQHHFDIKIWIECSFETALKRAIDRRQEGLSLNDTIAAYQKIYFPAQRIHLHRDQPLKAADMVMPNDAGVEPARSRTLLRDDS